jgi:zinc resistance-associated protein
MKRLAVILGSVILVGAVAYPVFAWGPGMGRGQGQGISDNRSGGPGSCWRYDRGYSNLTQEQQNALGQLNEKFSNETATLRNDIRAKADEMNTILNAPDPDAEKAKSLQKEIIDLRGKMAEKRLDFRLEARKISPDARFGGGYGKGYGRNMKGYGPRAGMGYGRQMEGYGPRADMGYGRHMKGYGPRAGMGYGRQMEGYGPRAGMGQFNRGGYGQGPCWN